MKKVLIISASPRKNGNSDLLCDEFARGAKEAGHEVEKIRLAEKNVGYCSGCYACQKLNKCVKNDDANELVEKMLSADVIVLAKDANRTGRLAFFGSIEEARTFFGKDRMEEIVKAVNRQEEGGEGRADEFILKYAEGLQNA